MNCQVTPFRNKNNLCDSTSSLSVGRFNVIVDASMIFLTIILAGAYIKVFRENK